MNILKKIMPQGKWEMPVFILMGSLIGFILLIFHLSNADSYISDDPKACVNCHVMTPHYATWFHSSHRERASCNDCHVPHDNLLNKYYFKAKDGARHSTLFTLKDYPQNIRIHEPGMEVVQSNCIRCHLHLVNPVSSGNVTLENFKHGEGKLCWDCHREVPHGRVSSQASAPYARVPSNEPIVPEFIKKMIDNTKKSN